MKNRLIKMCFFIVVVIAFAVLSLSAESEEMVSPALQILATQNSVAKAGLVGEELCFSEEEFKKALNVSRLSSITVREIPSKADGVLYLGGSEVTEGQLISAANLSHLRFIFAGNEITDSRFCFSTNAGAYVIECNLYSLRYENAAPVISSESKDAVAVSTYKNVTVYGKMEAYDPEGDSLVFEIIEHPKNGMLTVIDSGRGEYRYVPVGGYTGNDSFRYVVVDKYGNYSAASTVSLSVETRGTTAVFADMKDSAFHVAALSLADRGIMEAAELGGAYYFHPNAEVSRESFVVMAMKCMDIEPPVSQGKTVFADDADIDDECRDYVSAAQKLGYICGRLTEDGTLVFAPKDPITRAEAATILHNIETLAIPVFKPIFLDTETVPVWAADAVYAMTAAGIIDLNNGYVSGEASVTKGQCAEMLYRLSAIK